MQRINSHERRALRRNLCHRCGGCCAYCGLYVGMAGTVDHYLAQALGGTNAKENLRWCCNPCNGAKGQLSPEEWERVKPPFQRRVTALERRQEILSSIAPRRASAA